MKHKPNLIVMLTYNDLTVHNAAEIFDMCRDSGAEYWGFKEEGLLLQDMKELFGEIKRSGKKTVLEVVSYTEAEGIRGAEMAAECGVDIMMGTMFSEKIKKVCHDNGIRYMPFVGDITDRPSVLGGDTDDMIRQANDIISRGADGIDLLAYRYTGDCENLIRKFLSGVDSPVCIAGSVNTFERLDFIKYTSPWAFTIGSAFFEHDFGDSISFQIETVMKYMESGSHA